MTLSIYRTRRNRSGTRFECFRLNYMDVRLSSQKKEHICMYVNVAQTYHIVWGLVGMMKMDAV